MATADAHPEPHPQGAGRPDHAASQVRRARRCIVATIAMAGVAVVVCAGAEVRMVLAEWTLLWQPLALVTALVAAGAYDQPLPFRDHRHAGRATDVVVAFGLFWLPLGCLVATVAAGAAISKLVTRTRRHPHSVPTGLWRAFSAATTTLATAAAAAVVLAGMHGVDGATFPRSTLGYDGVLVPAPTARTYVVVVAAMAAYFLVGQALSRGVASLLAGGRRRRAWWDGVSLAAARWSAATAYGLIAAAVAGLQPGLLPALVVPLAASAYTDRAWSRGLATAGERRAEQAKADFVANISHELRTPLTPIKGFLLTLLREDRAIDEDRRRGYYRLMLGQAERLEALVEDLLDVTRLETGADVPAAARVDAAQLAVRVVQRTRALHPDRAIQLSVPVGEVTARGSEQRISQVLAKLLSNALRFTPDDAPVRVQVAERRGEIVFEVADAGPGIPPGEQARIFERFHRGGAYLPRDPGGAGLGLYLAKKLVEAMRGRIWVSSRTGQGATFTFALPAAGEDDRHVSPASDRDRPAGSPG